MFEGEIFSREYLVDDPISSRHTCTSHARIKVLFSNICQIMMKDLTLMNQ